MEAIKNLRESSALLSNLGFDSYRDVANLMYGYDNVADVCDIISCPSEYVDTLVGMVRYNAELRNKIVYDAFVAYATEGDYRAIYAELLAMKQVEAGARELLTAMSNNGDASEEKKEERIFTHEEEEAAFDTMFEAQFGSCQCFGAPRTMVLGTSYDSLAEMIYRFEYANTYVLAKPSHDLDIEEVKKAVLIVADAYNQHVGDRLREEAIDADYRDLYRELYILLGNDIADIDEDVYLHDGVPYSIEMRDGHRVVYPHFEQTIEADEIKEGAFFDEDFDLILNEENGKVEVVADHYRLTKEDYEEIERLEVDDNFHASLCEADYLHF